MNEVIDKLFQFNWQTIGSMFIIGWYFTREIRISLEKLEADVRAQGARTDKLYEIWVEHQKDLSNIRKETDQKFYDMLKERK
jgi:hypothetical protein